MSKLYMCRVKRLNTRSANGILAVVAAFCCILTAYVLFPDTHNCVESFYHSEVKSQHLPAATEAGDIAGMVQPVAEVAFSFSVRHDTEKMHNPLWVLHQSTEPSFNADARTLTYLISFIIHHYKTALIFPFHHFL